MKRLGALFSALCVAALLWSLWLIWAPHRQSVPTVPHRPSQGWHIPGLPKFQLPHFNLPDLRLPDLKLPRPPARPEAPIASPVERILIEKSSRRMTVWQRDGAPRTFRIALGFAPDGDKSREGDGRTPEGIFKVDRLNRQSAYHLSLGLDYPQRQHREAARKGGYDPGGDIMIHGQPNEVPDGYKVKGDWTAGCIAVTNAEIEEIFAHADIGTEVEIRP
ncbi:L,D-transpeptidase family protein [Paracoccus sp. MBLB3053]|uniref:L,D-transpeptidase family protein n=1 Tax=Paracoccus aurantius TaxID=3073814 RepID=A0ABU2HNA4_9RHOB|nr:L,D-transpeptidase family protein [Paracoccus sp. MBLB3053]MDS9466506.1 L,D-transpeptidase family protein [Paracoccus sp. MBLB3053]